MDRANAIFDQIDAEKSGQIDSKELIMALLGLGQEHETVSDLFRVLDTDGNGSISREEFIAGFDLYQKGSTEKKWVCRSWLPHALPHSVRTGYPHTPTQGNTITLKRRLQRTKRVPDART